MNKSPFTYFSEQFADIRILRYQIPDFEQLDLPTKKLLYFLSQAAYSGRDIIWDQNYKHNLLIRNVLELIYQHFKDKDAPDEWSSFETYLKRVWFSNGIHHHNAMDKILPDFSREAFRLWLQATPMEPVPGGFADKKELLAFIEPILFDPAVDTKRVVLDEGTDLIKASANNYYGDEVTMDEAISFYENKPQPNPEQPLSHGLNSKLEKENGNLVEKVWKVRGMYGEALEKVVYWLREALPYTQEKAQREALEALILYFETGDLQQFDRYNFLWLKDTRSAVDVINGFIEVYGDPLGRKGSFESVVSFRDETATRRVQTISDNALWFEQHSTTETRFKKDKIEGVTARAVNVVAESGDCSPATPIGINLPNADWIRSQYGSKSVTIANIVNTYHEAGKESGVTEEFAFSDQEVTRARKYGLLASNLHVDMHEIVGHGSGKILEGVGDMSATLKNYASTIEEARADLVALYFALDEQLVKWGLMPDVEVGKAEYDAYIRGALLTQLVRIEPGKNIEESHMRNRQLIAAWAVEKGRDSNVIEKIIRNGKTYFVINDYDKLRNLFGKLLAEIQRIKSEGDFEAAKELVEKYGVKVSGSLHQEVLRRWEKLKIAPYAGFINPLLSPVYEQDEIVDIEVSYPDNFAEQMLYYSRHYSTLPVGNKVSVLK